MLPPADYESMRAILGELDPLILEQIALTEATVDEVAAAYAAFEAERSHGAHRPLSTREAAVYALIEEALDDTDESTWNYLVAG